MKLKNDHRGSVTVEAAFVFPIVLLVLVTFMFCFEYLKAEYLIAKAMTAVTDQFCENGIPIEHALNFTDEVKQCAQKDKEEKEPDGIRKKILEIAGRYLEAKAAEHLVYEYLESENNGIFSVAEGISFKGSRLYDDGWIDLKCTYELKNPVGMFVIPGVKIVQQVRQRYFTGHKVAGLYEIHDDTETPEDEEENDEEEVYITAYGTVYHKTLQCPSLKLNISEVTLEAVPKRRNEGGAKYYPCEHCMKNAEVADTVYITTDGDRYHSKLTCSGLKRTITKVKLSEVIDERRACKRCNK